MAGALGYQSPQQFGLFLITMSGLLENWGLLEQTGVRLLHMTVSILLCRTLNLTLWTALLVFLINLRAFNAFFNFASKSHKSISYVQINDFNMF